MEELIVSVIELSGTSYELGRKQGELLKTTKLIEQLDFLDALAAHSNPQKAKDLLKNSSPNLLKELEGLSKGLEMNFDTTIRFFSGYDVLFPEMGCTAFITDDYYVRNYDFSPDFYDARLVFSNPVEGYASVGFSQQVIGRLDGMNERGLVVGLHFVNSEYRGEGFLATTIVRMLLEQCECIEEAVELLTNIPHGYCYNYSITDSSGKGVVVEASPENQFIISGKLLICTNYFQSKELLRKNKKYIQSSIKREEYLSSLFAKEISPINVFQQFNDSKSPLFFKHYKEYFGTLHTVVYSPKDLSVIIGIGENSEPIKVSLREYVDGSVSLPKYLKGRIQID